MLLALTLTLAFALALIFSLDLVQDLPNQPECLRIKELEESESRRNK